MSNNATPERCTPASIGYPREQREAHAEQHILICAGRGPTWLERTSSYQICRTYGVPDFIAHIRAMKEKLRPEFMTVEGK